MGELLSGQAQATPTLGSAESPRYRFSFISAFKSVLFYCLRAASTAPLARPFSFGFVSAHDARNPHALTPRLQAQALYTVHCKKDYANPTKLEGRARKFLLGTRNVAFNHTMFFVEFIKIS